MAASNFLVRKPRLGRLVIIIAFFFLVTGAAALVRTFLYWYLSSQDIPLLRTWLGAWYWGIVFQPLLAFYLMGTIASLLVIATACLILARIITKECTTSLLVFTLAMIIWAIAIVFSPVLEIWP